MSTQQLNNIISDGPSLDQMLDSLKYAFSRQPLNVRFRAGEVGSGSFVIEAIVKSIGYESGRSGSFLFEADILSGGTGRMNGYYDAIKRRGSFKMMS